MDWLSNCDNRNQKLQYRLSAKKFLRKQAVIRLWWRHVDNNMYNKQTKFGNIHWIKVAQVWVQWRYFVLVVLNFQILIPNTVLITVIGGLWPLQWKKIHEYNSFWLLTVMGLTLDVDQRAVYWIVRSYEGSTLFQAPTAEAIPQGEEKYPIKEMSLQHPHMQGNCDWTSAQFHVSNIPGWSTGHETGYHNRYLWFSSLPNFFFPFSPPF